ncbi:MAG: aminotransferase class V-fold PLP-dependent enzyme [Marinovum sp.]|nr:aminotransferase class V-fold PLP-dependent enzyme [Marinovum sp.]
MFDDSLLKDIRARFAHVEDCPFQGPRIFFENAGGALTLNDVVATSAKFAALPDNPGRANPAGQAAVEIIAKAKADAMTLFNAKDGQIFVGESGTELTFRILSAMILANKSAPVIGSTVEHPASRSACERWCQEAGSSYIAVPHDDARGLVTPDDYAAYIKPDVRVATILHTSPVTGMGMDLEGIAAAIRAISPECLIFVDGIQHASHGQIDVSAAGVDAYVVSPYKCFSRHGYGLAWISPRVADLSHDALVGGPSDQWELGTRDVGSYATFSDVVAYFDWLGGQVSDATAPRDRIEAAGRAIHDHEKHLTNVMLKGTGNLPGLADMEGISIVGDTDTPAREGLVSFWKDDLDSEEIVTKLNAQGIRTHVRKADHYSGNILTPLGQESCVRVSLCHYNSVEEVTQFLAAMKDI